MSRSPQDQPARPAHGPEYGPEYGLDLFSSIDWLAVAMVGIIFYFATPYVLDWTKSIYEIIFTTEGRESFDLMQAVTEGSTMRRVALLALAGLGIDGLIRGRASFRFHGALAHLLILYLAVATGSLIWAQETGLTFRKVVILWCVFFGAAGFAARLDYLRIITTTMVVTAIILAVSVGSEIAYSTFHPFSQGYRFAGVMHPIMQGWNCGLLFLSALTLALLRMRPNKLLWLLALAGLAGVVLTRSRWPLACSLLGGMVIFHLLGSARAQVMVLLWAGLAGVLALFYITQTPGESIRNIATLGRGEEAAQALSTFTGRTRLWAILLDLWSGHPLLGLGYNTFQTPEVIKQLQMSMSWVPSNAHSGYIQFLLGMGLVGLTLFLLILATAIVRAWNLARTRPLHAFSLGLMVWLAVNLVLESAVITDPVLPAFVIFAVLIRMAYFSHEPDIESVPEAEARQVSHEGGRKSGAAP